MNAIKKIKNILIALLLGFFVMGCTQTICPTYVKQELNKNQAPIDTTADTQRM